MFTNFSAFNNPSTFLFRFYWCSIIPWRLSRWIETCKIYDTLHVKNIILTLVQFLVLLCELFSTNLCACLPIYSIVTSDWSRFPVTILKNCNLNAKEWKNTTGSHWENGTVISISMKVHSNIAAQNPSKFKVGKLLRL